MKDLVIIGAGGLGSMVHTIVRDINAKQSEWNVLGFVDDNNDVHGLVIDELPVLGNLNWLIERLSNVWVSLAIANPAIRNRIAKLISKAQFATLVHPNAWICPGGTIGEGCIIYPGVMLDNHVMVHNNVIINKNVTVGHDTVVSDFVTISPGVNIGGNDHIGMGCDLGINSCTVQGVDVGEWSVVGAGAAVVKTLKPNVTAVGVPAKVIKERPDGWHL